MAYSIDHIGPFITEYHTSVVWPFKIIMSDPQYGAQKKNISSMIDNYLSEIRLFFLR